MTPDDYDRQQALLLGTAYPRRLPSSLSTAARTPHEKLEGIVRITPALQEIFACAPAARVADTTGWETDLARLQSMALQWQP